MCNAIKLDAIPLHTTYTQETVPVSAEVSDFTNEILLLLPSLATYNYHSLIATIDHASLAEKSARKNEKTLCWPPPLITHLVTKSMGNKTAQK